MAHIYVNCGEYDKAIEELDYMLSKRSWNVANDLKFTTWLKPLYDLPKYKEMIAKYETSSRGI